MFNLFVMKTLISRLFFFTVLGLFIGFTSCKDNKEKQEDNTSQVAMAYACPMDCEDGKVYANDDVDCPVCNMKLKPTDSAMICDAHKDGKCKCDGKKCKCANCKEHNTAMTCTVHEDGNCTCEGDKCQCSNCPKHS
ncbi:MAG: hypothetical protein Tsb0033_04180 [Winogradskyella sp.]|jgi:hypothetical protein